MGIAFSEPAKPPPVVLVPPKFYRDHHTLEKLFQTPLAAWLTSAERRRLFGKGVPGGGRGPAASWGRVILTPPLEQSVVVDASLADTLMGQLSIRAYPNHASGDHLTAVEIWTKVQSDAGSPLLRGAYFFDRLGGKFGLVGGASLDILTNPSLLAPSDAQPDPALAARLAAAGPDSTTGAFVGARYHSEAASAGAIVVGVPTPIGPGGEVLAWVQGRKGSLTLGAETALSLGAAAALPPGARPQPLPLKFGAFYAGQGFDVALITDSRSRSSLLGFYLHQVLRRKVQNPFEREDVVGIANYLDLGIEFRWSTLPPSSAEGMVARPPATLDLASSWQINKNWLVKGSVSSTGLACVGAFVRSWTTPAFSFGASLVADLKTRASQPALSLMVENTGDIVYERPSRNTTFSHPTVETIASPEEVREGKGKRPLMLSLGSGDMQEGAAQQPRVTFMAGEKRVHRPVGL